MHRMPISLVVAAISVSAVGCRRMATSSQPTTIRVPVAVRNASDGIDACTEAKHNVRIVGDLTPADVDAITMIVKQEDDLPLLSIVRRSKTTKVMTGSVCGPLCGSGRSFVLEKVGERWRIIERGWWES
jgi:hypothetical protein